MSVERRAGVFSNNHLIEISKALNMHNLEVELTSIVADRNQDRFEGLLGMRHVAEGFDFFANDFVALQDSTDTARASGQFILRMPFQDTTIKMGVSDLQNTEIRAGQALAIRHDAKINLEGRFHKGRAYRDVFLKIAPDADLEPAVLEAIFSQDSSEDVHILDFDTALGSKAFDVLTARRDDCVLGLLADSIAAEILAAYLAGLHPSASNSPYLRTPDEKKLMNVREKLVSHPYENHRLVNLARDSGMSVSSLKTKFRDHFGQSVVSYLRSVRLDHARIGILEEGWTVAQAARNVGYRHTSSFSKAYFKKFGVWPSQTPH